MGDAYERQYSQPGYAYGQVAEDSESEDEASSQVSPSTPTQDQVVAPEASSKSTVQDAGFTLRPATFA